MKVKKETIMKNIFILVLSSIISTSVCLHSDLTRENDANGAVVVDSVISTLRWSCLFDDHLLYLRRKAYVDTHDGTDPFTFVLGFKGGIWKVNIFTKFITEILLLSTRNDFAGFLIYYYDNGYTFFNFIS